MCCCVGGESVTPVQPAPYRTGKDKADEVVDQSRRRNWLDRHCVGADIQHLNRECREPKKHKWYLRGGPVEKARYQKYHRGKREQPIDDLFLECAEEIVEQPPAETSGFDGVDVNG